MCRLTGVHYLTRSTSQLRLKDVIEQSISFYFKKKCNKAFGLITPLNQITDHNTKLLWFTRVKKKSVAGAWTEVFFDFFSYTKSLIYAYHIPYSFYTSIPFHPKPDILQSTPHTITLLHYFVAYTSCSNTERHAVRRLMHLWKSCTTFRHTSRADWIDMSTKYICLKDNYRSSISFNFTHRCEWKCKKKSLFTDHVMLWILHNIN